MIVRSELLHRVASGTGKSAYIMQYDYDDNKNYNNDDEKYNNNASVVSLVFVLRYKQKKVQHSSSSPLWRVYLIWP